MMSEITKDTWKLGEHEFLPDYIGFRKSIP